MTAELCSLVFASTSGAHSRTAREIVPRSGAILSAPRTRSSACATVISASVVFTAGPFRLTARHTGCGQACGKMARACRNNTDIEEALFDALAPASPRANTAIRELVGRRAGHV